ncbi:uncharacterized protein LOC113562456 isoform X2 [Ooceraea biroi]|uniref:uncharacterized protein LOC113562456 isoform X2 n=1 Tax=Ooceraea biroi TaxID=2015173 RepID=UPI000F08C374|nr:uncharacterized protein LOC113562456 isoform X2 [Ooceraea biroi]
MRSTLASPPLRSAPFRARTTYTYRTCTCHGFRGSTAATAGTRDRAISCVRESRVARTRARRAVPDVHEEETQSGRRRRGRRGPGVIVVVVAVVVVVVAVVVVDHERRDDVARRKVLSPPPQPLVNASRRAETRSAVPGRGVEMIIHDDVGPSVLTRSTDSS